MNIPMPKQQTGKQTGNPDNSTGTRELVIKSISESCFILAFTAALFMVLSLVTYHVTDPGWSHASSKTGNILNAGGRVGAYLSDAFYFIFGYIAYFLPVCFLYLAWIVSRDYRQFYLRVANKPVFLFRGIGLLLLLSGGCGLLSLKWKIASSNVMRSGGIFGQFIANGSSNALNTQGALLLLTAVTLVGTTWLTGISWVRATEIIGHLTLTMLQYSMQLLQFVRRILSKNIVSITESAKERRESPPLQQAKSVEVTKVQKEKKSPKLTPEMLVSNESSDQLPTTTKSSKEKSVAKRANNQELPSLGLLDKGQPGKPLSGYTHQDLEAMSREVEQHLLDFGIQVDVVAVHPGPVITRFELQLAAGVKVSRLTALSKDLARSLSVTSVRVVEIIPGKTVVGIELPNPNRTMVCLSEVLSAEVYQQAHSPLSLALGVDIAGNPMVVDLSKMPHLLVAGTTGSGKSVGINAMILSLLFKAGPEHVRLIMVDPKMLELSVYDGIPHLLTPVVTDMKEAASALRWCVGEMERRYRLMASMGVRNLAGFNLKITESAAAGVVLTDPAWKPVDSMDEQAPALEPLPYIVVIIDELADMMMVVGKKVEQLIARIAQKARAAGIHLILATQRPSVDVLTGLIKSNIPTRISFQVSSKIDSRTILDQQGAEQLLGHGDMLFLAPGTGAPLRVHGAFVDDSEVHRIASDWRARGEPQYIEEITQLLHDPGEGEEGGSGNGNTEDSDPLYDQAVEFVMQTRKASISSVQRRFKIGYNRAARLVEEMERTGLVGPLEGGFRDVLMAAEK